MVAGSPRHLLKLERKLRGELEQTLDQIETLWFQKSRVACIRDGDCNTKYFHTAAIIRRRNNRVDALRDRNGVWCANEGQIQETVVTHFQQLFTEELTEQIGDLRRFYRFPKISTERMQTIELPFTEEEMHAALKAMHPFKAPGPDGFQAFFFQRFWPIVTEKVCNVALNVFHGHPLPEGLNETFITLIPKVPNVEFVTQLRPIGLCNVSYKLITKCIVQRRKHVLPDLISPVQSSFVPGR